MKIYLREDIKERLISKSEMTVSDNEDSYLALDGEKER